MKSKLIVALDVSHYSVATRLVRELSESVEIFKVGSELFTLAGPKIVRAIHKAGKQVFLDLKFHDIPNTVAAAVAAAGNLNVAMLTVHVAGGAEMLEAAVKIPFRPKLLGVTVLTSVAGDVRAEVLKRARLARDCGLEGVIASPRETAMLRSEFGSEFLIVTPGIRPSWAAAGDQKRVMTPAEAVAAGADYIVVGRPVVAAPKPAEAAAQIVAEISSSAGESGRFRG